MFFRLLFFCWLIKRLLQIILKKLEGKRLGFWDRIPIVLMVIFAIGRILSIPWVMALLQSWIKGGMA